MATKHLTVRLSEKTLDDLRRAAELERRTRSQLVRILIEDFLDEMNLPPEGEEGSVVIETVTTVLGEDDLPEHIEDWGFEQ
jgi:metal-responsive CopG/Arc/MetJ family transcriptional regulator